MNIKLPEIANTVCCLLDEVNGRNYDWVIGYYEIAEDDVNRYYDFSIEIREFTDVENEDEIIYMVWNLKLEQDINSQVISEVELDEISVDWKVLRYLFSSYVWNDPILFFLEQEISNYQALGVRELNEDDHDNLCTDTLAMYDNYMNLREDYINSSQVKSKNFIN